MSWFNPLSWFEEPSAVPPPPPRKHGQVERQPEQEPMQRPWTERNVATKPKELLWLQLKKVRCFECGSGFGMPHREDCKCWHPQPVGRMNKCSEPGCANSLIPLCHVFGNGDYAVCDECWRKGEELKEEK